MDFMDIIKPWKKLFNKYLLGYKYVLTIPGYPQIYVSTEIQFFFQIRKLVDKNVTEFTA